ncbi:MAG: 4Fe-4S dicluster domain-containing protein [Alphaproteobacteria bacterium]|nr:4Fe-4S dicluster domain-containing protein [Alphaproteobacteria bacterium]
MGSAGSVGSSRSNSRGFGLVSAETPGWAFLSGAVSFLADACLTLRKSHMACEACASACPAKAISLVDRQPAIGEGCTTCGRCAAACPTGAIRVRGFDYPLDLAGSVALECGRVSIGDRVDGAIAVPCLGGVAAEDVLSLHKAGDGQVAFVDRGWCADCEAGCGQPRPWAKAAEKAAGWMAVIGVPASSLPAETSCRLVASLALPLGRAAEPLDRSRRAFLSRAGVVATEARPPSPSSSASSEPVRLPRRERALAAMEALADHWRGGMTAWLFPKIEAGAGCQLHGVCAAVCPTGALARIHELSQRLEFNPALCIGCDECSGRCPEQALTVQPHGRATEPLRVEVLAMSEAKNCAECGQAFAASDGGATCPVCRKSRDMAREGFALFHRAVMAEKMPEGRQL